MGKVASLTAVHPMSPFGIIEVKDDLAVSFKEKPTLPGIVNGGFFVFNKKIFDYLDDNSVLEEESFRKLTNERQLAVYQHDGFWTCMDTYKDVDRLNKLWETGFLPNVGVKFKKIPWKIWDD
jgi:glucose-1-phosphate cytidylyltransferase